MAFCENLEADCPRDHFLGHNRLSGFYLRRKPVADLVSILFAIFSASFFLKRTFKNEEKSCLFVLHALLLQTIKKSCVFLFLLFELIIIIDDFCVLDFALDRVQNRVVLFVVFVIVGFAAAFVLDLLDFFDFSAKISQNLFFIG